MLSPDKLTLILRSSLYPAWPLGDFWQPGGAAFNSTMPPGVAYHQAQSHMDSTLTRRQSHIEGEVRVTILKAHRRLDLTGENSEEVICVCGDQCGSSIKPLSCSA